jgi:phosphopantothenoylcysteine decarboxylase / phosphopantothenate---cysteine ligase
MRIALGVTGGIAAYKAAELLRLFQDRGLEVQVIMTKAAQEFVTPLTFSALSGRRVITGMFESSAEAPPGEGAIEHITVAQRVDALVIAPATADVLARLAHGIADDFLTTLALATRAPVIVAPAMNVNMWEHAATRANIAVLVERGVQVIEPGAGYLACGMTGAGRMAEMQEISEGVFRALHLRDDLENETLLVTAGPTHEPIDPVRYLGNRSSGKMGFAFAEAGIRRRGRVLLVSGPTHLEPPPGIDFVRVVTAEEMADAVLERLPRTTVLVMTAAVSDFRPASAARQKIKKQETALALELQATRDILSEVQTRRQPGQCVVGFAAETNQILENASAKLRSKGLDLIVANDVTQEGAGFAVDTNIATILFPDGRRQDLPQMTKFELANRVLDEVVQLRRSQ